MRIVTPIINSMGLLSNDMKLNAGFSCVSEEYCVVIVHSEWRDMQWQINGTTKR